MIAAAGSFLLALSLTLYPLVSMRYNTRHQSEIHTQYQAAIEQADDSDKLREKQLADEYNVLLFSGTTETAFTENALESALDSYTDRLNLTGNGIMGYVRIPKIQAVLPIYHGTADKTLEIGVGHLLGSSLPVGGENTHTILTGHSGMASQKMFSDLPDLQIGDIFYLDVLGDTLAYQVEEINTVLPQDTSLLGITEGEDYCTLVTCTPFGVNTHRLLVRGTRVPVPVETMEAESLNKPTESMDNASSTWEKQYINGILWGIGSAGLILFVFQTVKCIYRSGFGGKYVRKTQKSAADDSLY